MPIHRHILRLVRRIIESCEECGGVRNCKIKTYCCTWKMLKLGTERILYFTSNDTYGERIVSTKSGKKK